MIDIHSHILFGVDDGSKSFEESVEMLKEAKKIGFDTIVATPHVMRAHYDKSLVEESMRQLRPVAEEMGIRLVQGFEYNLFALSDDGIEGAMQYCTEGENVILVEFKTGTFPANWERIIIGFQREGVNIVVAHPERYAEARNDLDEIKRTAEMRCTFQVDLISMLNRGLRDPEKKCVKRLLKNGLVRWMASDAHSAQDYRNFGKAYEKYGNEFFCNSGDESLYGIF